MQEYDGKGHPRRRHAAALADCGARRRSRRPDGESRTARGGAATEAQAGGPALETKGVPHMPKWIKEENIVSHLLWCGRCRTVLAQAWQWAPTQGHFVQRAAAAPPLPGRQGNDGRGSAPKPA